MLGLRDINLYGCDYEHIESRKDYFGDSTEVDLYEFQFESVDWIVCQVLVNMAMNLLVSYMAVILFFY
jgi:hypothetical protein